jgi:ketosteroid isomerase-like protein
MPGFISDSPLARDLIRIGDEAIAREDDAALRAYFREDYVFHGPGGDLSFDQLRTYFASLRAAFSDLRLVREQIIVDGNFLAARTRSPVTSPGSLPTHPSVQPSPLGNTSSGN